MSQVNQAQQNKTIITVLKCLKCSYTVERQFREGDFVLKIDGTCPNDGSPLYVWGIYAKSINEKK
ncbi:hypothetical protein EWF20_09155 [Sulfolobus sp. S-194]|uniref:hypothetical protein n=1 Tax=Sulfolobus sp. S-194 TaxID=2512240 RepID=UPI0014373883|nr:hypothetical protein [Sulfolobus sp. S-194]QIW24299.1 hypothetical protein EWF20_09155 [Sulfolobus sp. S-194]